MMTLTSTIINSSLIGTISKLFLLGTKTDS